MERSLTGDGRVHVTREVSERVPLLQRLRRIEGQVRGLIEMIEADRYCGDEMQQIAATRAALREVAVMLAEQHVEAAAAVVIEGAADDATRVAVARDIGTVLRAALRSD